MEKDIYKWKKLNHICSIYVLLLSPFVKLPHLIIATESLDYIDCNFLLVSSQPYRPIVLTLNMPMTTTTVKTVHKTYKINKIFLLKENVFHHSNHILFSLNHVYGDLRPHKHDRSTMD